MEDEELSKEGYWEHFYARVEQTGSLRAPSQFAAFVAQEIETASVVFDVGCGSGRDSHFFAALGHKVIALDQSQKAVEVAQSSGSSTTGAHVRFLTASVGSDVFEMAIAALGQKPVCVYARFFLHAIREDEQAQFFKALGANLTSGHKVAFEYRTEDDADLQKQAPPHFRRYQGAEAVRLAMQDQGFDQAYLVEGRGFAKFGAEDAIVARHIFQKV